MTRDEFLCHIREERDKQDQQWGHDFDDLNTVNDWVVYITRYAGMAATKERTFHQAMIKAAAICCAAVETYERRGGSLAPRHYDHGDTFTE